MAEMRPGDFPVVSPTTERPFELEDRAMFEYAIGVKSLQVGSHEYTDSAAFVSRPVRVDGNIVEIELEAVEEHPRFDSVSGRTTERKTSVEYYVSGSESPGVEDWLPILPKGETQVRCERLFFEGNTARLRFPAELASVVVYRNGLRLPESAYVVLAGGEGVQLTEPDLVSLHTVDYRPDVARRDPWRVGMDRLGFKVERVVEEFKGGADRNNAVLLGHYPYVDRSRVTAGFDPNSGAYRPFEVSLVEAEIIGENGAVLREVLPYAEGSTAYTYDRTDHVSGRRTELSRYSLEEGGYRGFDYRADGRRLVFSEPFNRSKAFDETFNNEAETHGDATIRVAYDHARTDFRLKVVLRRNTDEYQSVSPQVHEYSLRVKTMA